MKQELKSKFKHLFVGIDIGLKGGIVAIDIHGKIIKGFRMPVKRDIALNSKADPKMTDSADLLDELLELSYITDNLHIMIEDIHAQGGRGADTTFSLGRSFQSIIDVCEILAAKVPNANYKSVQPKTWQAFAWDGTKKQLMKSTTGKTMVVDTKATSEIAALKTWDANEFIPKGCRSIQDGLVDAALIALYLKDKKSNGYG